MTKKYILGALNICILFSLVIFTIIGITSIGFLSKVKNILLISTLVLISVILLALYLSKNQKKYNAGVFITLLLNIVLLFNIVDMNKNYNFIENIVHKNYNYLTYNLYVQKSNTTYNNIYKLENKSIGLLNTNEINVEDQIYDNIDELREWIQSGEIQAFIIDSNVKKEDLKIINKVRIIYSNRIKTNA